MKRFLSLLALVAASAHAATLAPVQLLNPVGSTSGQVIKSNGPSTAPSWGNVSATALGSQAANSVIANVTSTPTSPTAFVMPGCSSSTSALQYTSGTGFTCYTNLASLTGATFTGNISVTNNVSINNTTNNDALDISATGSNGALIKMIGNGATTPSKILNVSNGAFKIINDSFSSSILTLTDAGVLSTTGGIAGSPISGSTGSFTTLGASGLITPTYPAGIKGNVSGSNVSAGSVGEYLSNTASAVSATSATLGNVVSLPLTAGDWDLGCSIQTNPAGSTITSGLNYGLTTTSAGQATFPNAIILSVAYSGGIGYIGTCPTVRLNVSASTTVYLTAATSFSTSTLTHSGFIWARRR